MTEDQSNLEALVGGVIGVAWTAFAINSDSVSFGGWLLGFVLIIFIVAGLMSMYSDSKITENRQVARTELQTHGFKVAKVTDEGDAVSLNETDQKIILRTAKKVSAVYLYRDILASEIVQDGRTSITKTQRGSQLGGALIGGLALGGSGAIIGGLSGSTSSQDKVQKIEVVVTVNDTKNPIYRLLVFAGGVKSSEMGPYMNAAQEMHGLIKVVIEQADAEDKRQEQANAKNTVAVTQQYSVADEIAKLIELRDQRVLTEEEFASQKVKLLAG